MADFPTLEDLISIVCCRHYEALHIEALMKGQRDPLGYSNVAAWARACYSKPDDPSLVMAAIDQILDTHGVEPIRDPRKWDRYWGDTIALYCNTGEAYAGTVIYDPHASTYLVTSWADWLEKYEAAEREIQP